MNRRAFLTKLLAVPLAGIIPKENLFFDELKLHGAPFISNIAWGENAIYYYYYYYYYYYTTSFEYYVNNPKACGIITNIEEP